MITETAMALRASKNRDIIMSIASLFDVSLENATDIFYNSETSQLIEEGVADLHCRSSKYLATLVWEEHMEKSSI